MGNARIAVVNLGCRVNRVESDRISTDLLRAGFELVDEASADVVIINTCAVTGEAEAKTRKAVRRALGMPPAPLVIATGCAVNLHPESIAELSPRVIVEPSKVDVVRRVRAVATPSCEHAPEELAHGVSSFLGRSRLGIKIQDGCNHRCTYCIVWKARGPERSIPVASVLEQVREAEDSHIPEIVLTGVNLGAYDGESESDSHVELDELISIILRRSTIPQVRLSSIEPMDVSDRLIARLASSERIAPFLHLPLQSGCDATLHRMARPYTSEDFLSLVKRLREAVPSISLSCDVIVGFPGETDEEFEESLALCRTVGFSRMHVFRYSKRPGTPAAAAPNQVAPEVMAERSARMRALAAEMSREDALRRVDTIESVVLETAREGTLGSFQRVVLDTPAAAQLGSLSKVRLESVDEHGVLHGRLLDIV